ncbi:hypothetical protein B0H19DRAFT_1082765 [Mycena capillaripes]|nr:hypothetical protein B0H19DRAFT_1082765 [Mycena capillaripes]
MLILYLPHCSHTIDFQTVEKDLSLDFHIERNKMNHAFELPEIVESVISEVDSTTQPKDLATLARTSTTFHNIALDALWRNQSTLLNLIRCMPADLWETVERDGIATLSPRRALVTSDWNRVFKYALRIKSLVLRQDRGTSSDPDLLVVYQTFRHGVPGGYLLPNLEKLSWRYRKPAYAPFIELFLGPRTTSIHFYSNPRCPVIATLGHKYPALLSVSIGGVDENSPNTEKTQLFSFVRNLTSVETIDIPISDSETLRHLGRLTTLKTLRTVLPTSMSFDEIPDASMFFTLRAAKISGEDILALIFFIRKWNNPKIRELEVQVDGVREVDRIRDFYEVLGTRCAEKYLQTLKISITQNDPAFIFPHPKHFFECLFRFSGLRNVEVIVRGGQDLDDVSLSKIARAWPQLERLVLGSWNSHPGCTLLGLDVLAQYCPLLAELEIALDASNVPHLPIGPPHRALQEKLTGLRVGVSPIPDAFSVARFISVIFSKLTKIDCAGWQHDDASWERCERWNEVQRLLRQPPEVLHSSAPGIWVKEYVM